MTTYLILKRLPLLIGLFAVFNVTARTLGTLQPPDSALAGFSEGCEAKPQPCWYGIVPGRTSVEEAARLLTRSDVQVREYTVNLTGAIRGGAPQFCSFELSNDGQVITTILARYCPDSSVPLGAFVLAWGAPLGTRYTVEPLRPAQVIFHGATYLSVSGFASPFDRVLSIIIFKPDSSPPVMNRWFGFAPEWRYCQLEPNAPSCPPLLP